MFPRYCKKHSWQNWGYPDNKGRMEKNCYWILKVVIFNSKLFERCYEKREIIAFVPKKKRGKVLEKIQNGESGEAIIYNIHSGWIKTESTPYIDGDLSEAITTTSLYIT